MAKEKQKLGADQHPSGKLNYGRYLTSESEGQNEARSANEMSVLDLALQWALSQEGKFEKEIQILSGTVAADTRQIDRARKVITRDFEKSLG